MSTSIPITNKQIVAGNLDKYSQFYEFKYYPVEGSLMDKLSLYIYLQSKSDEKEIPEKMSLFFANESQFRDFVREAAKNYFYFLDKRIHPDIPISKYREIMLSHFLADIRQEVENYWKENPNQ